MYRTVLLVTIICNIWGFPTTSMVPVIAKTILNINATLLGILVGAEGAGCLIGSIIVAGVKNKRIQSFYNHQTLLLLTKPMNSSFK